MIDSWVGFLGSAKPNFIDTSLLGNVRITITLAGAEVFSKTNAGCTPTYTISDQHFSMDVVSISDGIYDAMVDQMLASGAPLEIPFKNYFSFTDRKNNMDHQFNFHVASQSIDRLWAVPRAVLGNEAAGVTATDPAHEIVATDNGVFRYATCQGQSFQFQVNNTLYPNWSSTKAVDWWQHTKLAVGDQGNMLAGAFPQAMQHYTNNFFVYACSLEHQTDGDERFMSGIDTRGAAASCMFKSTVGGGVGGAVAGNNLFVFAECTSSLKIMANKVLEIVQ